MRLIKRGSMFEILILKKKAFEYNITTNLLHDLIVSQISPEKTTTITPLKLKCLVDFLYY